MANEGFQAISKYGKAIPRPVARKTVINTGKDCMRLQPRTPPNRGPLHGVASKVAKRPVE